MGFWSQSICKVMDNCTVSRALVTKLNFVDYVYVGMGGGGIYPLILSKKYKWSEPVISACLFWSDGARSTHHVTK